MSEDATLYGRWRRAQSTVRSSLATAHIQINICCWTMALLLTTILMMSAQWLLVMYAKLHVMWDWKRFLLMC